MRCSYASMDLSQELYLGRDYSLDVSHVQIYQVTTSSRRLFTFSTERTSVICTTWNVIPLNRCSQIGSHLIIFPLLLFSSELLSSPFCVREQIVYSKSEEIFLLWGYWAENSFCVTSTMDRIIHDSDEEFSVPLPFAELLENHHPVSLKLLQSLPRTVVNEYHFFANISIHFYSFNEQIYSNNHLALFFHLR